MNIINYFSSFALYQWLTLALALLMLAKAVSHYRHHRLTGRELVTWLSIWIAIGIIAIQPRLLELFGNIVGVKDGVNGLLAFWLIVLTYANLRLFLSNEKNKRALTQLTRESALRKFEASAHEQANQTTHDHRVLPSSSGRDGKDVSRSVSGATQSDQNDSTDHANK